MPPPPPIHLRPTTPADIPALFEMQLDAESNRLAGTRPRDRAAFDAVWEKIFRDQAAAGVTPRTILAGGVIAGCINIFPQEGRPAIGYWIAREHWGRGIAGRAIALMLAECATRPLHASIAAHNTASRRALERNGFVEIAREHAPATDRYTAGETIKFRVD
jgi:RimJ/RimL family protein N-acetyltransferase